jgi:DNA-binding beta-propeller fold protein YncE
VTQGPNAGNPRDHLITFKGGLGGADVEPLKVETSGLTGGGPDKVLVEESVKGFDGHIGEGSLANASGVAAYTYKVDDEDSDRYVFAADAVANQVEVLSGADVRALKARKTIEGPNAGEGFDFGAAGAYLAVDPGNRNAEGKCTSIAGQACTAGHLLVYDAAHEAVDEFDASGEFLDQLTDPGFADAQPTAIAVERSGGPNDGTVYVTAGEGTGAKLLAFRPLSPPSRSRLGEPLSHLLAGARAVATDSFGDVYVSAETTIYVFGPAGNELTKFEDVKGAYELAVDSQGDVYVLEGAVNGGQMTYYAPTAYPPTAGATYNRHEPLLLPSQVGLFGIGIDPSDDHVFVARQSPNRITEFGSAKEGSPILDLEFASGANFGVPQDVAFHGASGNLYVTSTGRPVQVIDPSGTEILNLITGAGAPSGSFTTNSAATAVDQANGHLLFFAPGGPAREYDASGAFVAEFGTFTAVSRPKKIAVDSACALHQPPLTETTTPKCSEFDPSNGNVYVAFDDTAPGTFDLTAFAPLSYSEPPAAVTGFADGLGAGHAVLHGAVDPRGFDLTECKFEYLADSQYLANGETFAGSLSQPCAESLAEIGHGTKPVSVHVFVNGLDPDARYRFRLVTKNAFGSGEGGVALFGPPVVVFLIPLPISYEEATLRAEVDSSGLATKYHFEYGVDEGYGQSTPVGELAPGDGAVTVEAALTGLAEGTTYHFRVIVENEGKTVEGPDQAFTTRQRTKSPPCENVKYRTGLSVNLPDCRAYELVTPGEMRELAPSAGSAGSAEKGFNSWRVDPHGEGAGDRVSYSTQGGTLPGFDGNGNQDDYRAERATGGHPAGGWTSTLVSPSYAQAGGGPPSLNGVAPDQRYSLWETRPFEVFEGTLPKGVYLRAPSGFEAAGKGSLGTDLEAEGTFLAEGGAHVVFFSDAHLEDEAAPAGTQAIYDRAAGTASAEVVSVKPDGAPFNSGENATFIAATEDGSAILFKVAGALYLRRGGQTAEAAEAPTTFAGVSEDGTRVFYAAASSGQAPATLFVCDTGAGPCAGPGAHSPTQIAADAVFVNVSGDGSHALYTSEEALTGAEENETGDVAEAGEHNLYAWDEAGTTFVAILDPQDLTSFDGDSRVALNRWTNAIGTGLGSGRALSPTRSSPDGRAFVFQSHGQLTAYDNEGFSEVYRYAPAASSGEPLLACVSCDPTGAVPGANASLQSIAGATTPAGFETFIPNVTADGGQVFFESRDRLLPEDANNALDVYEWQARGVGGCARPAGCLALISSGQGERDNHLYTMTPDGHDVFFSTQEKLVGADVVGSFSIYEARAGGGIPDPPPPAPCQGDACQGAGSAPPPLVVPATTDLRDGNVEKRLSCPRGKRKVVRGGKARCVKRHGRKPHRKPHSHRRRAAR